MNKLLLLLWICFFGFTQAMAQQEKITGKVVDSQGSPLPGVSVIEKGTPANGTQTNAEGAFSIALSGSSKTLIVTYIGFIKQEVAVNGDAAITVTLKEDVSALEEVIVTGYGTQKRQNLTGSIATVSSEKLKDVTSPNIANMMQGKVAGVDVSANTGRPGAQPTLRIRGKSSIRSSVDPLWVVDGVIWQGVPNLNPQDVESMTVLKDAAAAALYGSRGANGVMVVTTKSAKGEGTSTISASAKGGVSVLNTGNFKLMNSQQLYDYYGQFANPGSIPDYYTPDLLNTNTDWLDLSSQNGVTQDYSVSYMGATEKAKIYAGGNYFKEEGSVKGYGYERFSGRMNVDYKISKRLTFKPKISATYTATDDRQHSLYDMFRYLPWDKPYNADGTVVNPQVSGVNWYGRDAQNYLYDLQWNYTKGSNVNTIANADFQYDISDHFSFVSTNNITYTNAESLGYTDPRSNAGLGTKGQINNIISKRTTRFTNQMLNYQNSFGKHTINALAAYEYSDYQYNDVDATGIGIVAGASTINAASEPLKMEGTKFDYAFQSVLFNANYGYDNRYNLQVSFRRDGASRFGEKHKYGNFYAISGSWNIHNESFFDIEKIDYLRLKVAHGSVGNTPLSFYPQYELYSLAAQYNGLPAAFPNQIGNEDLTWERTYDTNVGLEFGLFERLEGTLEVYNKSTSGLLHFVPLPAVSGFSGYWDNIGAVRNRGIEFTLGADIFKGKDFNWHVDMNIGRNVNRITELYGGRQISGMRIIEVGQDVDTWYMRKWAGVNTENGAPQWEQVNPETGETTMTSNYNDATLQKVGNSTPDFYGGFGTALTYKNIFLNANFSFSKGAMAYNGGRELFDADGAYPTYNQMILKDGWSRWTPENTNATHPQLIYGGNLNANKVSSRYVEEASYLRLRNITAGYRFSEKLTKRLGLKGLSAFASVDNLFTITNYSGIDPEAAINGSMLFPPDNPENTTDFSGESDNMSPYPLPRRFTFGINVSL
ncbi:SusC/RagA family TonB-linked outer membrane protein [Olivibacter domesticus]|uniref:TonB-linked outer membrane protein, SusC/RagA family n=1 Tax=Olivibacter domesticus TaxID=407022 RepID=A0A1H7TBR2_OLID1|nr:TonB-dependent receptor [Olivibacter domesticus]SEL81277.1 TonB-linked outer membrane protein, SusC/RagA family [Olivibacter domesticus]